MCSNSLAEESRHPRRIVLLFYHGATPEARLAGLLERHLAAQGHHVWVDRHLSAGIEWAKAIEHELTEADFVVAFLSAATAPREMLCHELETARDAARRRGAPRILPVRVGDAGPLPGPLAALLRGTEPIPWADERDDTRVLSQVSAAVRPGSGRCPACAAPTPGIRFCTHCGARLAPPGAGCRACGAEVLPGSRFCGSCGAGTGR